jgi:DNA-binding response OmpR family regulator
MSPDFSVPEPVVLLVEDTASLREALLLGLETYGFRVVGAESGEEALRTLERADVSCVVTDLWMPGMSGEQLVKAIRTDHSYDAMPIVVMSAVLDVRITSEIPADVFLAKPFALEPLVQILDRFACRALH